MRSESETAVNIFTMSKYYKIIRVSILVMIVINIYVCYVQLKIQPDKSKKNKTHTICLISNHVLY